MFGKVEAAASERGLKLVDGKGNDPDTLGTRTVYVMDSKKFPFYQAEVCEYCLLRVLDSRNLSILSTRPTDLILFLLSTSRVIMV